MFCRLSVVRMILILKYTGATIILLSVLIEIGQLFPNNDCKLIPLFCGTIMNLKQYQSKQRFSNWSTTMHKNPFILITTIVSAYCLKSWLWRVQTQGEQYFLKTRSSCVSVHGMLLFQSLPDSFAVQENYAGPKEYHIWSHVLCCQRG